MPAMLNLYDLLCHEINDLYSAEEQILEAMPPMVTKASDNALKKALMLHHNVTLVQKSRLDKVRKLLKTAPADSEKKGLLDRIFGSSTKCKGTEGLIKEAQKMMSQDMDPKVMDAAIIAAAQKIEHYEIAGYGTARTYAEELGLNQVAELLAETLKEEYEADQSLTSLATTKINIEAENGFHKPKAAHAPVKKKAAKAPAVKAVKKVARKSSTKKNAKTSAKS